MTLPAELQKKLRRNRSTSLFHTRPSLRNHQLANPNWFYSMGLEDFEKELAAGKSKEERYNRKRRDRSRSRDREHRHKHRHHHRSSRHHDGEDRDDESRRHKHKRSRRDQDEPRDRDRRHKDRRSRSPRDDDEDEWVEKEAMTAPPEEDLLDNQIPKDDATAQNLQRDSWMQAPSALDVESVQSRRQEPKSKWQAQSLEQSHEKKRHDAELQKQLRDLHNDNEAEDNAILDEPSHHEVDYEFGDAGSSWRMTKLRNVYTEAERSGRSVDEVALERFGDFRDFDDAREEERELDRRKMYGKDYVGNIKPSGELFKERQLSMGVHRREPSQPEIDHKQPDFDQGEIMPEASGPARTVALDQTALNKLKANLMKAKLRKDPNVSALEAEYSAALANASNTRQPDVVVLGAMENRQLHGGRSGEVKAITNKRGRERGLVEENEDMSIEDMVRQERRTKTAAGGAGRDMAERIAKDAKFDNDLDYMDENAQKLAKRVAKSEINLKNAAVGDIQRMNKILDTCPLCHHDDLEPPQNAPVAPVIALGTRTFLTLPTEPEISDGGGAVIVPIQHRKNLLECDDDEWEEIRNFMKSLIRMYNQQGRDVIFYENAAFHERNPRHAAMQAVPIPFELGETAPAFFREAILDAADEWSQHKKIIDTLARSKDGLGKMAFRRSLVKEMPYFHVWFDLDGGMGHVVENTEKWPRGDRFAREIIGGMLDADPGDVHRQGKWTRGGDHRMDGFKKRWRKWDWTKALTEGQ